MENNRRETFHQLPKTEPFGDYWSDSLSSSAVSAERRVMEYEKISYHNTPDVEAMRINDATSTRMQPVFKGGGMGRKRRERRPWRRREADIKRKEENKINMRHRIEVERIKRDEMEKREKSIDMRRRIEVERIKRDEMEKRNKREDEAAAERRREREKKKRDEEIRKEESSRRIHIEEDLVKLRTLSGRMMEYATAVAKAEAAASTAKVVWEEKEKELKEARAKLADIQKEVEEALCARK